MKCEKLKNEVKELNKIEEIYGTDVTEEVGKIV